MQAENLSTIIQPIGIFKDLKASKIGACLKGSGTKAVTTIADGRIIPERTSWRNCWQLESLTNSSLDCKSTNSFHV